MNGYIRVAALVPTVSVADCKSNALSIIEGFKKAEAQGARIVVTPEMSITGYTCGDLFHNAELLKNVECAIKEIAEATDNGEAILVVGAPVKHRNMLFNCAVVIANGFVQAIVPKTYLPGYNEFYEPRWWSPAFLPYEEIYYAGRGASPFSHQQIIEVDGVNVGIEICEDLWAPIPPSSHLALQKAELILNISASNDLVGKYAYLKNLVAQQSARCNAGYIYVGAGYGESSTDMVFDGKAIIAENGAIIAEGERWQTQSQLVITDIDIEALRRERLHSNTWSTCVANESRERMETTVIELYKRPTATKLMRKINPLPFVPSAEQMNESCDEITNIQVAGLARRLEATRSKQLVIGISGGLDSTLALLVAVETFRRLNYDLKGIIGVTMPGFGTTGRTYNNALTLMRALGITIREIPIATAVTQHFSDIGHDPSVIDVTYENSQARERTQILMDIANQVGGMVLGTGDLSELALGWATYNGDHMSMYGINAGVPKTLVKHLVKNYIPKISCEDARTALLDIIDTPISPELTPAATDGTIAQKTEDLVGPYELHDFFLYYTLRYGYTPERICFLADNAFPERGEEIRKWIKVFYRRFFNQQFKRSCLPDGPKIGSVCLSPRGDWRMPSDASSAQWLAACEKL